MDIQNLIASVTSVPPRSEQPFLAEGMTHGQIHSLAAAIGEILERKGDRQRPVCLCIESRALMVAALLAALNKGIPLILPYAYSGQALLEARRNIHYDHALVEKPYPLPTGVESISVADPAIEGHAVKKTNEMAPDDVWLYMFTGGSTGSPRVWSKSPRNLLMEAGNLAKAFTIREDDIILATVPPNHIYGLLYSVLLPLVSGAVVSDRTPSFPMEIIQAMASTEATVFISIPPHYRALKGLSIPWHTMHTAFSSAGALSPHDDQAFFQSTGVAITEIYGSTETGGIAFRKRSAGQPSLLPFSYVAVRINGEQLWVSSDFLSRELNRSDSGFFLTSDRVASTGVSGFDILGRCDGIVKVGGKRVDLTEIRQVLIATCGAKDAYVFAMPVDSGRENEIVAVVEGKLDASSIMDKIKNILTSHACPRRIKVVDEIPVSATGKYDRQSIERMVASDG